jgi:hypothetical protein
MPLAGAPAASAVASARRSAFTWATNDDAIEFVTSPTTALLPDLIVVSDAGLLASTSAEKPTGITSAAPIKESRQQMPTIGGD